MRHTSPMPRAPAPPDPAQVGRDKVERAEVVAEHGPLVYGMCRRLTPDPEDCYQEIWEKVFKALHRFDPSGPASIRTWIATITHRHLVDRHRRRLVRGEVVPIGELVATELDPTEQIHRQQRMDQLENALQRLPEAQRRVVVMHHVRGVPLEDIAETEGAPVGTVKSRLHRGRARLAELMGKTG